MQEIAAMQNRGGAGKKSPRCKVFARRGTDYSLSRCTKRADRESRILLTGFAKGAIPDDMPGNQLTMESAVIGVAAMLKQAGLTSSTSESFRMIQQGCGRIDW